MKGISILLVIFIFKTLHIFLKVKCEGEFPIVSNATTTPPPPLQANVTTPTTGKPTVIRSSLGHSSSSSSSGEDQLTPLLLSNGKSSTCVNCPQTVCTLSKVSYKRTSIHHNWRVNGLPDYITYLEKFQAPFEMSSDVRFNLSSPMNGQWTFQFSRSGSSSPYNRQLSGGTGDDEGQPLDLRATYTFLTETRTPPRISFELWLSAHVEDEYVTLPSQISSYPSLQRVPLFPSSDSFTWTYIFVWSDIQRKLVNLMESTGLESQDVEFKFVINAYENGNLSSADADCRSWGGEDAGDHGRTGQSHHNAQTHRFELNPGNNATWPPFLSHMYSLMKDDKYTDLTVKSGDEEYQIHRVIAAYSSPILAAMIYNLTYKKSESLLDFGDDIGPDAVEELIRYMYTGKVEDIEEIADRLIVAATTYGFPALKRQCEHVLIKLVKTENAFSMYELGSEVGSMRLKRRAFNVMKENKSKIVAQSEEFRKLSVHHPDVMYELFLS